MVRTTLLSALFLLVPAVGFAQQTGRSDGDAKAGAKAEPDSAAATGDKGDKTGAGDGNRIVGGYTYSDKRPARAPVYHVVHKGPHAAFPSFAMVDAQRSRLTVQLSSVVAVEEKKAAGTVTYVIKGAHVARYNDTHALIAVHFNTPMTVARLRNTGKDVELRVDLRAAVTPTFAVAQTKNGATLTIDFPGGEYLADGVRTDPAQAPAASPAAPR
ncbi:MAG: hypothetical protein HOO96_08425 [Polyangiaceae bacterium]|nr:hypothetical protein [Polyangiaceae bacterium]